MQLTLPNDDNDDDDDDDDNDDDDDDDDDQLSEPATEHSCHAVLLPVIGDV